MPIRLVLADPHPVTLAGLESFCARENDFVPLACCVDGTQALQAVHLHCPDILLFDPHLDTRDGLGILREIRKNQLPTRIIIFTSALTDEQAIEVMRLGAHGVVLKTMPTHLLAQCIRKVHGGGQWIEKQSISGAIDKMLQREAGARRLATILTSREIETLRLVASGLSNPQVAERLHVKTGTVKIHLHHIYKKLGLENRVALTLYAQRRGLV